MKKLLNGLKKIGRCFRNRRVRIVSLVAVGVVAALCAVLFLTPFGYRPIFGAYRHASASDVTEGSFSAALGRELKSNMMYCIDAVPETEEQYGMLVSLARYLDENKGLSYIGIDIGYCVAELFNLYVESGEEEYLDVALASLPEDSRPLYRTFCEGLRNYNSETKHAIRVFGWNNDSDSHVIYTYVSHLISVSGIVHEGLAEQIYSLLVEPMDSITYLFFLNQSYQVYSSLYHGYFRGNYLYFSLAMEHCTKYLESNDSSTTSAERQTTVAQLVDRFPRGTYLLLSEDTALLENAPSANSSYRDRALQIRVSRNDPRMGEGVYLLNNEALYPSASHMASLCRFFGTDFDLTLYDPETKGTVSLIWNR